MRKFLAPYEYPKEIEFIDALPMTTTGKVQRKVLRERERARKAARHRQIAEERVGAAAADARFFRRRRSSSQPLEQRAVREHPDDDGHDRRQDQRAELVGERDRLALPGDEPVCDAICGRIVIATFFRKSASAPHATNGISTA